MACDLDPGSSLILLYCTVWMYETPHFGAQTREDVHRLVGAVKTGWTSY